MERISNYQLFTLICLFEIGSTIIFGFSSGSGRAAWISVLISTFIGILINIVYFILMRLNPGLTLIEWYSSVFGKWIGLIIAWFYTLEFIYDGSRIFGDLECLVPNTLLPKTPIFVVEITFAILLGYALFSGIETIARLGELVLPTLFIIYFIDFILILSSGIVHTQYIKPLLGTGWQNIFKTVWPLGITQTFGQTIEFAMIYPLIDEKKKILKTTLISTLISGLFICILDIFAIIVLGENIFAHSIFPIYRLVKIISVGDFIENIDAVNVLFFLASAFFKVYIHLWCAIRAIQLLTFSKSSKFAVIPVVGITLYIGMNMARDYAEHLTTGIKVVPYNLWFPLFYVLPLLLLIVSLIKKRFQVFD